MRFTLAAILAVGIAFAVVLGLGFWIHSRVPDLPDNLFAAVAVTAIIVISFGVLYLLHPFSIGLPRRIRKAPLTPQTIAALKEREDRIAELVADPARKKYADLMRQGGQSWSDEQIRYDQDRMMVATCVHLQPVEYGMRLAGLDMRLYRSQATRAARVRAFCRIHKDGLQAQFPLGPTVQYREYFMPERSEYDNPTADIFCRECGSSIDVLHPGWAREGTPWFPSPPGRMSA